MDLIDRNPSPRRNKGETKLTAMFASIDIPHYHHQPPRGYPLIVIEGRELSEQLKLCPQARERV